jgi:phosphoenolpyruvate carboxylase
MQHGGMTDAPPAVPPADATRDTIAELLLRLREAREAAATDPFGDPVLLIALAISRRLDDGRLDAETVARLIASIADTAAAERARRLAAYVGLDRGAATLDALAARLVRPDPQDSPVPFAAYRAVVERPRFAAVFTAHPTFSLPPATAAAVAAAASGAEFPAGLPHRPAAPTLTEEFAQAVAAIERGRDALDVLNGALLRAARGIWGDRWQALLPAPVILSTWVGYDTDGRTDIGWWDTIGLRLTMKRLQLQRLGAQLGAIGDCAAAISARVAQAEAAVARQLEALPQQPAPEAVQAFAAALVTEREAALVTPRPLLDLFPAALAQAPDEAARLALAVARAGLAAHGLALAHTHTRLNASQIHNALRQRLGLTASPDDMASRRGLLAAMNAALAEVVAQPVDFGALLAEQASAVRLMMTMAQITKHVDGSQPVRFLIAETETGYTLLSALWLARRLGVERFVEISPLFETAEALERGERVLEEALRSPHWRDYIRLHGRMCLQFGYSDSGRYVGQLPGSYLAERLKLRLADQLRRHGLADIELVLFDTHGESIGRGAHPAGLADRFAYLSPPQARAALARAGFRLREETSFQGGDGYLLFGTPALAEGDGGADRGSRLRHALRRNRTDLWPRGDYGADFFATISAGDAGAGGGPSASRAGSAPSGRGCWTARVTPGGAAIRHGGGGRISHPPSFAPSRTTRSAPDGLAGEHAARAGRGRGGQPRRLHGSAGAQPALSPARWPWRRGRRRVPTSACCARGWIRWTPAPGSTAPARPRGLGGGRN